jgi:hypothetical protein
MSNVAKPIDAEFFPEVFRPKEIIHSPGHAKG